ncbi:hypothetical protein ACH4GK_41465 [Streptomyces rimosus]|uniref:SCO4402 family protein n=1 Tax=Streptomyces rimosus TaxID=1927 RepID=UPI0004CB8029|nr:hypothetical protein [Streptomyces rimosus]
MSQTEVQFPEMRERVISAVRHLSDTQYQRKVWLNRDYPHAGYYDDFTLTFNSLQDTAVLDDTVAAIGITLTSAAEAAAMQHLADQLEEILDTVGGQAPDSAFLASPLWNRVVDAAQQALKAMSQ